MSNPYHITGPSLLSISGGRTSGFMLHMIEATLNFLREVEQRWSCPLRWLEYRHGTAPNGSGFHTFEVVDFCSASRKGEPFAALIASPTESPRARRSCQRDREGQHNEREAMTTFDPRASKPSDSSGYIRYKGVVVESRPLNIELHPSYGPFVVCHDEETKHSPHQPLNAPKQKDQAAQ